MFSSTVKSLSISYDPINEENTFSNGDTISGRVTLELSKETELNALCVKAKGKANVHWTERRNDRQTTYHAKEDYFKLEHFIYRKVRSDGDHLVDQNGETYGKTIPGGKHVYPFSFQIPDGKMPSTYKGIHGKVVYSVKVALDRSMRMDQKDEAEFKFVSRIDMNNHVYMLPQSGAESKKMKLFTKGSANMKISIDRKGYMPGEDITITAEIENDSSRDLVPKFALEREENFYARGHRKQFCKRILKEEGQAIPSKTHQTNTYVVKIPPDLKISITHCRILNLKYELTVYLDVPLASDPEVVFPLIIFPVTKGFKPVPQMAPSSDFDFDINQGEWSSYPPPYGDATAPGEGPPPYGVAAVPGEGPPPYGPGGFAPPSGPGTVPGGGPLPYGPGGFAPPSGPGAVPGGGPLPYGPGGFAPPSGPGAVPGGGPLPYGPGGFAPPTGPGGYSAPSAPFGYPAQLAPGLTVPQAMPGPPPPQTAPSAPPPEMAPVDFLSQSGPGAPPELAGPVDFLSQTNPTAPTGIYPSLSDFGGKAK